MTSRRRGNRFTQHRYRIVAGKQQHPISLIRMPEGDLGTLPDIPTYFYQEEVVIPDDEESQGNGAAIKANNNTTSIPRLPVGAAAIGGSSLSSASGAAVTATATGAAPSRNNLSSLVAKTRRKRGRPPKPTRQWVLEAGDVKLYGAAASSSAAVAASTTSVEQGSAYFLMKIDEGKRAQLLPIQEIILLRQQPDQASDEGGFANQAALEYIEHGKKSLLQQSVWAARYGKDLVAALLANESDSEDETNGTSRRKNRRKRSNIGQTWRRTFKVDEDVEDDNFNPGCKTATNYNDIFGLMAEGDDREVLELAFEEVDTGFDEIPDGADDGFGAPAFGEDRLPERQPVNQEQQEPDPFAVGEGLGLSSSDDGGWEEEEEEEESSQEEDEEEEQGRLVEGGKGQLKQKEAFEEAFADYEADADIDDESSSGSSAAGSEDEEEKDGRR